MADTSVAPCELPTMATLAAAMVPLIVMVVPAASKLGLSPVRVTLPLPAVIVDPDIRLISSPAMMAAVVPATIELPDSRVKSSPDPDASATVNRTAPVVPVTLVMRRAPSFSVTNTLVDAVAVSLLVPWRSISKSLDVSPMAPALATRLIPLPDILVKTVLAPSKIPPWETN